MLFIEAGMGVEMNVQSNPGSKYAQAVDKYNFSLLFQQMVSFLFVSESPGLFFFVSTIFFFEMNSFSS